METILEVKDVSKKYTKNFSLLRKYGTRNLLKNLAGRSANLGKLNVGEFWAVRNVSLSVSRGESLGLIGLNGSGKSTLLKMLGGLLLPDTGAITLRGTVDSLIELGTGFHPSLSGRQNVVIKCAFNGFSQKETNNLLQEIIEFSELGESIDRPVKTYSSGMYARLGFSAAIFTKPDILLVDEILSVGDFRFRQKCLEKMTAIKKNCAIVFVNHSMTSMKMFCDRGIVLEAGNLVYSGDIDSAVDFYSTRYGETNTKRACTTLKEKPDDKITAIDDAPQQGTSVQDAGHFGKLFYNHEKIQNFKCRWTTETGEEKETFNRPIR